MIKNMVTIIIPTYNEADNISKIEEVLNNIKGNFEVIFSDGFSSDNTFDLINHPKIRERKFRSNQMNAAAKYAKGEYLFFLHADSIIGPDCVNIINSSNLAAGCFKMSFIPNNFKLEIISYYSNKRVRKRNIAFGDQGIFVKKELFEQIGGYKSIPLMEDYQLSLDLIESGNPIKQISYPIYTSSRKLIGKEFITGYRMKKLQKKYREGYDIEKIAEIYKKI